MRVKVNTFPRETWIDIEASDVYHLDPTRKKHNSFQLQRFICSWLALLGDSPLQGFRHTGREVRRWKTRLLTDCRGEILRCSALGSELFFSETQAEDGTTTSPFLTPIMDLPIAREYLYWKRTGDRKTMQFLLTFLWFGKKLPFDDPAFVPTAFRKWEQVEEKLSGLTLDPVLVEKMKAVIHSFHLELDLAEFWPKHGPGRVSERGVFGNVAKTKSISYDRKLDRAFHTGLFAQKWRLDDRWARYLDELSWSVTKESTVPISRMKFVPKDMKTARTICMEPATYMFFQQGLMRCLISAINRSRLGKFIRFDDQGYNRGLALQGSYSHYLDCLDLSSASDTVSVDLVRKTFPRELLYFLLATRTSLVAAPDGSIRSTKKFAPMGSALCFPVECILFAAAVIVAGIQEVAPETPASKYSLSKYLRYGFEDFGVYGDDIVCDSRTSRTLTHTLEELGFEVNTSKSSFGDQTSRESCGGYYSNGGEVTPYLYKIANQGFYTSKGLFSHIEHVNLAGDKGLRNLQTFLISCLSTSECFWAREVLFGSERGISTHIFSRRPRNRHLLNRWNRGYQRFEVRHVRPKPRVVDKSTGENSVEVFLHMRWWAANSGKLRHSQDEPSFGASRLVRGDALNAWGWTPAR